MQNSWNHRSLSIIRWKIIQLKKQKLKLNNSSFTQNGVALVLIWPASSQSKGQLPINCVNFGYSIWILVTLLSPQWTGLVSTNYWPLHPIKDRILTTLLMVRVTLKQPHSFQRPDPHWWGQGVYCLCKDQASFPRHVAWTDATQAWSMQEVNGFKWQMHCWFTELCQNLLNIRTLPSPGSLKNLLLQVGKSTLRHHVAQRHSHLVGFVYLLHLTSLFLLTFSLGDLTIQDNLVKLYNHNLCGSIGALILVSSISWRHFVSDLFLIWIPLGLLTVYPCYKPALV